MHEELPVTEEMFERWLEILDTLKGPPPPLVDGDQARRTPITPREFT